MCWVKSGKDIKNQEDLRNLITGVILRQPGNYQKGKIKQIVNSYLRGSSYTLDDRSLSQLIDDGLDVLNRNGIVSCWNGYYHTSDCDFL